MLAHELRNPLAPIRNALHILRLTEQRRRRGAPQVARDDGAPGERHGAAGRRPARRLAHHARQDRAAQGAASSSPPSSRSAVETSRPLIDGAGPSSWCVDVPGGAAHRSTPIPCASRRWSPTCSTTRPSTPTPGGRDSARPCERDGRRASSISRARHRHRHRAGDAAARLRPVRAGRSRTAGARRAASASA